jgi:hypothetical protein
MRHRIANSRRQDGFRSHGAYIVNALKAGYAPASDACLGTMKSLACYYQRRNPPDNFWFLLRQLRPSQAPGRPAYFSSLCDSRKSSRFNRVTAAGMSPTVH